MEKQYNRVLLKLSGEALAGKKESGIDFDEVLRICKEIKKAAETGVEIAIVVGGGNFWRGRSNEYMDKVTADQIGMLATTMNALAVQDALRQLGYPAEVETAIKMTPIAEPYVRNVANRYLEEKKIVIFGCGTGSPYFSTDTAAALRAAEIGADVIIKATNVDGVYTADPKKDETAELLDETTYDEVLSKKLHVMDLTAITLCSDNNIPIMVLNLDDPENIVKAILGEKIGTIVAKEKGYNRTRTKDGNNN